MPEFVAAFVMQFSYFAGVLCRRSVSYVWFVDVGVEMLTVWEARSSVEAKQNLFESIGSQPVDQSSSWQPALMPRRSSVTDSLHTTAGSGNFQRLCYSGMPFCVDFQRFVCGISEESEYYRCFSDCLHDLVGTGP